MLSPLSALERELLGYVERLVRASEASARTLRDLEGRSSNRIGLRQDGLSDCVALLIDSQLASMAELVALKPKQPKNLKTGQLLSPRVFGYGSSTGYNNRWKTICKRAGIPYLSAHPAGRHGFFTELVVRQGVDPVTAAKAGRWSDPNLPMRIYAHAETDEAEVRARFRTNLVQDAGEKRPKALKSKKEKRDE